MSTVVSCGVEFHRVSPRKTQRRTLARRETAPELVLPEPVFKLGRLKTEICSQVQMPAHWGLPRWQFRRGQFESPQPQHPAPLNGGIFRRTDGGEFVR
jgi:hypothetical protein